MPITFLVGLAFSAGIIAFFNPCSYVMLPAYISYVLGKKEKHLTTPTRRVMNGIAFGGPRPSGFYPYSSCSACWCPWPERP